MENKEISQAVVRRLPRYYRYLGNLLDEGIERISSKDLADRMKVTASQIRQDLNHFGGFGQQGYGYHVESLHDEIGKILGLDKVHQVIIIGAGHLGQAIANYVKFEKLGFKVIALFDVDKKIIGTEVRGIEVHDMKELDSFVKNQRVDIAALTIPKTDAPEVAFNLGRLGVKSIWNFAHVDLEDIDGFDKDIIVENVHLSDSLMQLSYKMGVKEKELDE